MTVIYALTLFGYLMTGKRLGVWAGNRVESDRAAVLACVGMCMAWPAWIMYRAVKGSFGRMVIPSRTCLGCYRERGSSEMGCPLCEPVRHAGALPGWDYLPERTDGWRGLKPPPLPATWLEMETVKPKPPKGPGAASNPMGEIVTRLESLQRVLKETSATEARWAIAGHMAREMTLERSHWPNGETYITNGTQWYGPIAKEYLDLPNADIVQGLIWTSRMVQRRS